MTVVQTPAGPVDFGNKSPDEIRSIIEKNREKFGLKPAGAPPAKAAPAAGPPPAQPVPAGAPPAKAASPAPPPAAKPAGAPPLGTTDPSGKFTAGVPTGGAQYKPDLELRADFPAEGQATMRSIKDLQGYLNGLHRAAREKRVESEVPGWAAEKAIPAAYNGVINLVSNALTGDVTDFVTRISGGYEKGKGESDAAYNQRLNQARRAGESVTEAAGMATMAMPEFAEEWGARKGAGKLGEEGEAGVAKKPGELMSPAKPAETLPAGPAAVPGARDTLPADHPVNQALANAERARGLGQETIAATWENIARKRAKDAGIDIAQVSRKPLRTIETPDGKVFSARTPEETHYDVMQRALDEGHLTPEEAGNLGEEHFTTRMPAPGSPAGSGRRDAAMLDRLIADAQNTLQGAGTPEFKQRLGQEIRRLQQEREQAVSAAGGSPPVPPGAGPSPAAGGVPPPAPPGAPPRGPPGAGPPPPPGGPGGLAGGPGGLLPRGIVPGAPPPPRPSGFAAARAAVAKMTNRARGALSPSTVNRSGAGEYGTFHPGAEKLRENIGINNLDTTVKTADLDRFQRTVNALPTGWGHNPAPPGYNGYTQLDIVNRIEGLRGPLSDPKLEAVATKIKEVFDDMKTRLAALPSKARLTFLDNYFTHIWKDTPERQAYFNSLANGKFGTGRFLKARSIPSILEGLDRGLLPEHDNILESTLQYVDAMNRHITKEQTLEWYRGLTDANGKPLLRWLSRGQVPPEGYTPLLNAYRGSRQAAMPEDFARTFNNHQTKGWEQVGPPALGAIGRFMTKVAQNNVSVALLDPFFHVGTILYTQMTSHVAVALENIAGGHPVRAAKQLSWTLGAPIIYPVMGRKIRQQQLRLWNYGARMQKVVAQMAVANMRTRNQYRDLRFTAHGSFVNSFKKGSTTKELAADWNKLTDKLGPAGAALPMLAKQMGRLMDTVIGPFRDIWIPAVKEGIVYHMMNDFMERNPNATKRELDIQSRAIVDTVDNNAGEMMRDNTFHDNLWHAALDMAMISHTWKWGFLRQNAGAAFDIAKALRYRDPKYISNRVFYLLAQPLVFAMVGGAYTYLRTGRAPQEIKDYFHPPTGGTLDDGATERITPPGHTKDWDEVWKAASHLSPVDAAMFFINSANPIYSLMSDVISGKDWRQRYINPTDETIQVIDRFGGYILNKMQPFAAQQAEAGRPEGSKISPLENLLGAKTAPQYISEPEKAEWGKILDRFKNVQTALKSDQNLLAKRPNDKQLEEQVNQEQRDLNTLRDRLNDAQNTYQKALEEDIKLHKWPQPGYQGTVAPQQ
jgi:hypothetical protein